MKTTLIVLCLLMTTAAFGQYYGSDVNSQPQIYEPPIHPAHASYAPMAQEQSIYAGTSYTSVQGERPASDFPQQAAVPLGDTARELKKQHAKLKKARIVWEQ